VKSYSKFLLNVIVVCGLLTSLFGSAAFVSSAHAAKSDAGLPVAQLLNVDGTLDLSKGYSGQVDIANYGVSLDPDHGPVFRPLATPNIWNALGSMPLSSDVLAIAISGADVYAGGIFLNAGGDANGDYVAKWNGASWSALVTPGSPPLGGPVFALAVSGGDVYAGGGFNDAGGNANADKIAKFSGGEWSALGTTPLNGIVQAIAVSGGDVYAGGYFTDAGGDANADYIAKFSSGVWSALGTTPISSTAGVSVSAIAISIGNGDVFAGGGFSDAGGDPNADYIAVFSGGAWKALGGTPLNGYVRTIALLGKSVYAGGDFTNAGGDANADYIAKHYAGAWSALGPTPLNGAVYTISTSVAGGVYAGGLFSNAGGDFDADYVARFKGGVWSRLDPTFVGGYVVASAISGGNLYAGGDFVNAGGNANADYIARLELPSTFDDVPSAYAYWDDIEILYANGLTAGCSITPLQFCPDQIMDRAESGVFVLRGNYGTGYTPPIAPWDRFSDDWSPGVWAEKWAEGMYNAGLTAGCATGPLRYCPWDQTPRVQAAVFGLRLKYGNSYVPPAATGTVFFDMTNPAYFGTKWAEQAYADGLLPNCGTDIGSGKPLFCPNDLVSRGLAAYMIVRARNLSFP
jgi:hypothetical protein